MLRLINTLFLSLTLALTSISMAAARGQNPDMGTDMVICTGVGMTTISIGADGEPVKTTHICPDSLSIFAVALASINTPALPTPVQWRAAPPADTLIAPQESLPPSARGPPLAV